MNAVARNEPTELQTAEVIPTDAGSLMAVISRAASDPSVDVGKLERLMDLYERITDRGAKVEFTSALAEMQPKLPVISERGRIVVPAKDGKEGHSTPYAKWEDINDAIRPILHEHGFALSFRTGTTPEGRITVTGILSHRAGHQDETTITLQHDSSGSKNAVQAIGSSVSYGKRYTAMALLNITTRGEDDDGRIAGAPETITSDQADELKANIESVGADRGRFLRFFKIESLTDLPASKFNDALIMLSKKANR